MRSILRAGRGGVFCAGVFWLAAGSICMGETNSYLRDHALTRGFMLGRPVQARPTPDGKMVSYVRDYYVYVIELASGTEKRLTTGGTERVSHGLAEFVAQEEMDRFNGYWWSPDSKQLIFQESDASEVETWFVADPMK